jgi:deazaflavin-dependent oxidoreductase (nitroreductase family)
MSMDAVAPAPFVRIVVRPMTKVLNPVVGKLAGRRHFPVAAQIRHVGRRSGRRYVTSAGARLSGDAIVIPLTFGNRSDWSQNVRAAGGCTIRLKGRDYAATEPEFVSVHDARPLIRSAFSPAERASFRLLGIRQVLTLHAVPAGNRPGEGSRSFSAPGGAR